MSKRPAWVPLKLVLRTLRLLGPPAGFSENRMLTGEDFWISGNV